jgi:nucleoid DNA-binding protein
MRDFGVLRIRFRAAKKARNPRTGGKVMIAARKVPYFNQCRILKGKMKS